MACVFRCNLRWLALTFNPCRCRHHPRAGAVARRLPHHPDGQGDEARPDCAAQPVRARRQGHAHRRKGHGRLARRQRLV